MAAVLKLSVCKDADH